MPVARPLAQFWSGPRAKTQFAEGFRELAVARPLLAGLHLTDAPPFGLRGSLWDPGLVVMAAAVGLGGSR